MKNTFLSFLFITLTIIIVSSGTIDASQQTCGAEFRINDPGSIHLYDENNQHTGILDNATYVQNIPGTNISLGGC